MAAARLGYLIGPSWVVAELEKVVLPYHLDALKQAAGCVALDHVAEMEQRVATLVEERGRVHAALAELPLEVWPSSANFILFRPRHHDGDAVWADAHSVLLAYQDNGRLRTDIVVRGSNLAEPTAAQWVVVQARQSRYFPAVVDIMNTRQPALTLALDDVPLVMVYRQQ